MAFMTRRRRNFIFKLIIGIPITWFTLLGMSVMFSGGGYQDTYNMRQNYAASDNNNRDVAPETHSRVAPVMEAPNMDRIRFEEKMKQDAEEELRKNELRRREDGVKNKPVTNMEIGRKKEGDSALGFIGKLAQGFQGKPEIPASPNAPGEQGRPVNIEKDKLSPEDRKLFDAGWKNNAFNQYASDMISLHRSLPDIRDKLCKNEVYPTDLPETSVIICFHNEAWTTLLRTVHSVLDRSPDELVKEIILVDDFSDQPHLKTPLEEYAEKLGKVKVLHTKKREGLIRARLLGASVSTSRTLTYLDSHCECTQGWLEPMLARIAANWSNVVTPVIDVIDDTTFRYQYSSAKSTSIGGFDWNLQFNWHAIPEREKSRRKSSIDPVRSPTMAGGLFAISKEFFEHLGTYDPGMDIWGGENLELSFKTWMCGGQLEIIPCSHVGHIFRKRSPYSWKTGVNIVKKNSIRLAEVWLDEYKKYYYERFNFDLGDYGDVSARKNLRDNLQCKSFQWYIDTVYPELFIPGDAVATGEIRNKMKPMCLDSAVDHNAMNKPIKMWPCHRQGGNQFWMLSGSGEIRRDEGCMDYAGQFVMIYPCHSMKGNQEWVYGKDQTIHQKETPFCMTLSEDGATLLMEVCSGAENQKWIWNTTRANAH